MQKIQKIKQKGATMGFQAIPDKIKGRVIINLWRYLRNELQLTNYEIDNVSYHVLKKRIPKFSFEVLSRWWRCGQLTFHRVIDYILLKL